MASPHLQVRGPSLSLPVAGELLLAPDFPSPFGTAWSIPVWDGLPWLRQDPVHLLTGGCIPMDASPTSLGMSSWHEQHLWWKEGWIKSGMAEVFWPGFRGVPWDYCPPSSSSLLFLCSVSLAALPHPGQPFLLSLALLFSFLNAVFLPEHSTSSWP